MTVSSRKKALPATCPKSTAGKAIQPFKAIFFVKRPETAANTASSAIMKGRRESAGMGSPQMEVMAKLTSGERTPTASPQRVPRMHPASSTGRYMGSHLTPPACPSAR